MVWKCDFSLVTSRNFPSCFHCCSFQTQTSFCVRWKCHHCSADPIARCFAETLF